MGTRTGSVRGRTTRLLAATAGAGLALAACGSAGSNGESAKAADQILANAKAATSAASSVHVAGTVNDNGTKVSIDVKLGHGSGGGMISQGGETFQIVEHTPNIYLKADAATWTKLANKATAQLVADKWIQTTVSNPDFANLAKIVDLSQLVSSFTPTGTLTKGSATTFDGASAIPLDDKKSDSGPSVLYVAATGKPYILGLSATGSSNGKITFSEYGSAQVPAAPSGAINFDTLTQSGS